jgi:hypothetical protein
VGELGLLHQVTNLRGKTVLNREIADHQFLLKTVAIRKMRSERTLLAFSCLEIVGLPKKAAKLGLLEMRSFTASSSLSTLFSRLA